MAAAEKATNNVSVWLTDTVLKDLDGEIEILIRALPGARMSRSAFVAEIVKKDLEERAKRRKDNR